MLVDAPNELEEFVYVEKVKSSKDLEDYYLYFLWIEDDLVYIGITINLQNRIAAHKKDKYFDKITYQLHPQISRKEMLIIEKFNIEHYKPVYNNNNKIVIIKKPNFCIYRKNLNYELLEKDGLYRDDIRKEQFYYNGKNLFKYEHINPYIFCYKDDERVLELLMVDNVSYTINLNKQEGFYVAMKD